MMRIIKINGFTLIELMIVVAILGILSAIAIPKFGLMVEKSREGATKGNIGAIISAISIYYADNKGIWPENIADPSFENYLKKIPPVKVTHRFSGHTLSGTCNTVALKKDAPGQGKGNAYGIYKFKENTDGWLYDSDTGNVWVNNSQTDTTGLYYTLYGYE